MEIEQKTVYAVGDVNFPTKIEAQAYIENCNREKQAEELLDGFIMGIGIQPPDEYVGTPGAVFAEVYKADLIEFLANSNIAFGE